MSADALLYSALTVLFWGVGAYFDKQMVDRLPPLATFVARTLALIALMIPVALVGWRPTRLAFRAADGDAARVVVTGMVFTTLGIVTYYLALSRAEASKIVPLCSVYPLVAAVLAFGFLREPFTWLKLAGTVLVIGGSACLVR